MPPSSPQDNFANDGARQVEPLRQFPLRTIARQMCSPNCADLIGGRFCTEMRLAALTPGRASRWQEAPIAVEVQLVDQLVAHGVIMAGRPVTAFSSGVP